MFDFTYDTKMSHEIIYLIIVIACIIIVAKSENFNGRIEQCNDLGMKFIRDVGCITNETYINEYSGYNSIRDKNIIINPDLLKYN